MNKKTLCEIALIERILKLGFANDAKWWDFLRNRFVDAGWITQSSRKGQWLIIENSRQQIEFRLNTIWSTRDTDILLLQDNNLDILNPKHLEYLPALREKKSSTLKVLNRRNLYSVSGVGPKQKSIIQNSSVDSLITHDAISRFRPNAGLILEINDFLLNLDDVIQTLNEFSISERAIINGLKFKGNLPKTIITIENLGVYIDLVLPEHTLVVFSPGSDIRCATQLLKFFTEANWIHFGDIDPEGIKIAHSLGKALLREPKIYIPSFTNEYLNRAQKKNVIWDNTYGIAVLDILKENKVGIFQEIFILDERLSSDIEKFSSENPL